MMKMLGFVLSGLSVAAVASAADIGDPVFPKDLDDKARAELIYENMNRGLNVDSHGVQASDTLEADVYMLRIHTDLAQAGYLDFDIGAFDPSGGDTALYAGVGLRYLAYDDAAWRASTVAQIHYAPNVESGDEEYDLTDGDLAFLLARKLTVGNQLTIMPYVGPVLSIVRIDGDGSAGDVTHVDFSADEDQIFGGVAGLSLQMQGQNGLRIEGRYFDDFSVSAAAALAF